MHRPLASRVLLAGAATLLCAATAEAQIRVALCAAESSNTACNFTDPQTKLLATSLFSVVDIINVTAAGGGTPTLAQLQQYDALMVWTNSTPADNVAWGNVLADYVDAGGGVVVTVYANSTTTAGRNIAGRWQTGYEVIMDQSGNASGAGGALGTVHVPGHPVMNGVTSFTGGTIGSRPNGTALEVGATLIAEWNNGKVLVAVGANPRRVDLGFFPVGAPCTTSVGYATGGEQLMANALVFVAGGAGYAPYGTGCPGSLGVPTLAATGGSRPVLGQTFSATAGNLPLDVAIVTFGFSNTTYGPFSLPLALASYGMPGCNLLAEPATTAFIVGSSNRAAWTFFIPNNPLFSGAQFYNQAFSLDGPINAVGLAISNGGRGRVGL